MVTATNAIRRRLADAVTREARKLVKLFAGEGPPNALPGSGPARIERLEDRRLLSVTASGTGHVDEGNEYWLHLSASTDGAVTEWTIDWGDGTPLESTGGWGGGYEEISLTHAYLDGIDNFTITAVATDEIEEYDENENVTYVYSTDTVTSTVTVNNVDPTFSLVAEADEPSPSEVGCMLNVVDFEDPGQDTVSAWVIDWGDGTSTNYAGQVTSFYHAFQAGGQYTITATATDEDGSYSQSVTVELGQVPLPQLTITGDATIGEAGIGSATVTVRRDKNIDLPVTVSIGVGGTATPGADYTLADLAGGAAGGTIQIPAGAHEATFRVVPRDDFIVEPDETVALRISSPPQGYTLGDPSIAVVTITDNEQEQPPPGPTPPTGTTPPYEDTEPDAWVDVSLGGYGWWHDNTGTGNPEEQSYGSTKDGPGQTTGGFLRLNRDYDESADYEGETPPPTDLEKPGIVPWDGEVTPLWIGAWTDSLTQETAEDSVWSLTWDAAKVKVWSPEHDEDGHFTGYVEQSSGWSGTLADVYWGIGAMVEPIAASTAMDDVAFTATLTPAEGSAVEDTVKATVYDVDLDIDSDNTVAVDPDAAQVGLPERDATEEWYEEAAKRPGKIVAVNDGDLDADGVVDFADFDGIAGHSFVPVVLSLPPAIDHSNATIRFSYAASDPADVQRTGAGTASDPYVYTPASGLLRLWKDNADAERDPETSSDSSAYIAANTAYSLQDLGLDTANTVTVWLEAVRPSETLGDGKITVEVDLDGSQSGSFDSVIEDTVHATAIGFRLTRITESGQFEPLTASHTWDVSHPSPVLSNMSIALVPQTLQVSSDAQAIVGDIRVAGQVDDPIADLLPGVAGTITKVSVFLNGSDVPFASATVSPVSAKLDGTGPLLKPFDVLGAFDTTLPNVALQAGWNQLKIVAVNSSGYTGSATTSFEVIATAPQQAEFDVEFDADPYSDSTAGAAARYRFDNGAWGEWITLSRAGNPPDYIFSGAGFTLQLVDVPSGQAVFDSGAVDVLSAIVTSAPLGLDADAIQLTETEADTGRLGARVELEEHKRPNLDGYSLTAGGTAPTEITAAGSLSAMTIELQGPTSLAQEVSKIIIGNNQVERDVVIYTERMFVADPHFLDRPSMFLLVPGQLGVADITPQEKGPQEKPAATFGDGLKDGLLSPVTDLVETAKMMVEVGQWIEQQGRQAVVQALVTADDTFHPDPAVWTARILFNAKVKLEAESAKYVVMGSKLAVLGEQTITAAMPFLLDMLANPLPALQEIHSGTHPVLPRLPEQVREALEMGVELLNGILQELGNATEYDKGWYLGFAISTVVTELLAFALSAGTGVGNAITLPTKFAILANRIGPKFAGLGGKFIQFLRRIDIDVDTITRVATPKPGGFVRRGLDLVDCFVAGTPVMTANGLVAIEDIRVGDLVLARDPRSGEQGYRAVLRTLVTEHDTLYRVEYDPDGTGPRSLESITATSEHPFYVDGKGFTSVSLLNVGDAIRLADGAQQQVVAITTIADSSSPVTTYNLVLV